MSILLASASPRRRELLALAGVPFEVVPSDAPELQDPALSVQDTVIANAKAKAAEVSSRFPSRTVLGADTLVTADGIALGKPRDREEAGKMLRFLSGRTHEVMTGVCITNGQKTATALSVTRVTFRKLSDSLIDRYVQTGECDDKAGAYGIQGKGCILVERIDGDYFGVVGLPICKVVQMLEKF